PRSEVQALHARLARRAVLPDGEHDEHAQADVLLLQDAPRQRTHVARRDGTECGRRQPAPRERGVPRRRDRVARTRPFPRQAHSLFAGGEDAVHRPLDGEARDRSPQGRPHRPRADLRSGRVAAPHVPFTVDARKARLIERTSEAAPMAESSILDALDALKKLEESLKSRDAEYKERETSLQEQATRIEEDRRLAEQERTSLADERDSLVGREKGLRAREKELELKERDITQKEQEFEGSRQQVLAKENQLIGREQKLIGEEEAIATARAKLSEEGRRLLEREKQLLLQEQTGRTPGPMAAQAPVVRPAVSPAPASTAPRPQPVVVPPQSIASKPAA